MSLNKKVLSLAIFGALASGNALAADLSASPVVPAYFAKEIIATTAAPRTLTTNAAAALSWKIGYNFSAGEVRFARVECSNTIQLNATSVTSSGPAQLGSINGLGTNVLTFSLTSPTSGAQIVAANTLTVVGNHAITSTASDVTCAVGLYDQPSQAQAGGSAGLIAGSSFSGAYLSFAPSYQLVSAAAFTQVAQVESDPAYSEFVPASLFGDLLWTVPGALTYSVRDPDGAGSQNAPFRIDGTEIALSDLFASNTYIHIKGDLSAYNSASLHTFNAPGAPNSLSASAASFQVGSTALNSGGFRVNKLASTIIQESEYFASLSPVAIAPSVYAVTPINNVRVGEIVRNGTQLQAPLAQVPAGWISRMVLTNTGSADRAYEIEVQGETGNNISTDATKLTGTVPANGTVVVDLNGVLTGFTAAPRATLNVTVAGPDKQIQGLYQIVNPEKGSISNHAMLRPGTN